MEHVDEMIGLPLRSSRQPSSKSLDFARSSSLMQSCFREPRETVLVHGVRCSESNSSSRSSSSTGRFLDAKGSVAVIWYDVKRDFNRSFRNSGSICASCE